MDGDQDQLQQLVLNLVLNALDAMPEGGTLETEIRPPRDGYIELYVRDSGPGIAPDILPKVFETFVSSKETGIGLGVPVSLRIAEEHGGTLTAFNLPGSGALLRPPTAHCKLTSTPPLESSCQSCSSLTMSLRSSTSSAARLRGRR